MNEGVLHTDVPSVMPALGYENLDLGLIDILIPGCCLDGLLQCASDASSCVARVGHYLRPMQLRQFEPVLRGDHIKQVLSAREHLSRLLPPLIEHLARIDERTNQGLYDP